MERIGLPAEIATLTTTQYFRHRPVIGTAEGTGLEAAALWPFRGAEPRHPP